MQTRSIIILVILVLLIVFMPVTMAHAVTGLITFIRTAFGATGLH